VHASRQATNPSLSGAARHPAMEGFDTITMSYLAATPMSLQNVTAADQQLSVPLLPLDTLDHHSNYDAETFAG